MSQSTGSIEVFCSYVPADEPRCHELEAHLSLLRRQDIIATWHRRDIAPDTDWTKAIDAHLNTASLILLLISPDFIASDYRFGRTRHVDSNSFTGRPCRVWDDAIRPVS